MKSVAFVCHSSIVRNNGITRFMIEGATILRRHGVLVDLITDNPTPEDVASFFDAVIVPSDIAEYASQIDSAGLPLINHDPMITERLISSIGSVGNPYSLYITNDLHSGLACEHLGVPFINYLHTAALIGDTNYTYLSDSYLDMERDLMSRSTVGVPTRAIRKMFPVWNTVDLGLPISDTRYFSPQKGDQKTPSILFVGEGTRRKGADTWKSVVSRTPYTPHVVSSGEPEVQFDDLKKVDLRRFSSSETAEKANFIRQSRMMYFPSRCETVGYVILEALLSQPVLVDRQYPWAASALEVGAELGDYAGVFQDIERLMKSRYAPDAVTQYLSQSRVQWENLLGHY